MPYPDLFTSYEHSVRQQQAGLKLYQPCAQHNAMRPRKFKANLVQLKLGTADATVS